MTTCKNARKILGISQSQMAKACNTNVMTISKWETGARLPNGQAQRLIDLLVDLNEIGGMDWFKSKYMSA